MTLEHVEVLRPGSRVEVWNRSLGRFGGSFEVAETTASGVRVRRPAEPTPLPGTFTPDEVRLVPWERGTAPSR